MKPYPKIASSIQSKMQNSIGLTGYLMVSVGDKVIGPVRNLWLDQGLNRLAAKPIAEAFRVAIKGTAQNDTAYEVPGSNTYTLSGTTLTRAAGTRDFSPGDVGKLVRSADSKEGIVDEYTNATHVELRRVGAGALSNFTTQNITLHRVDFTELTNEAFTALVAVETISKDADSDVVTATGSVFQAGDVGKCLFVSGTEEDPFAARYTITGYTSGTEITVGSTAGVFSGRFATVYVSQGDLLMTPLSRSQSYGGTAGDNGHSDADNVRTYQRTFVFEEEPEYVEYRSSDDSATFTWSGTSVTRTSAGRNFTVEDVGKYIRFDTDEVCKIASCTSVTIVVVDRAPVTTITDGDITALYGGRKYDGFAFSDSTDPTGNANVLVKLPIPVLVLGTRPEEAGQQLRVTYTCIAKVGPIVATSRASAGITDPGNQLSVNKYGVSVVEQLALSGIEADGDSDLSSVALEPYEAASAGLSASSATLVPLVGVDARNIGAVIKRMRLLDYVKDSFEQFSYGAFGVNEGVGSWRSVGIYDTTAAKFAFSWLFESPQTKTAAMGLTLRFYKTWNRDLS